MNCEKGVIAHFCANNVNRFDAASQPLITQQPSSCRSGTSLLFPLMALMIARKIRVKKKP